MFDYFRFGLFHIWIISHLIISEFEVLIRPYVEMISKQLLACKDTELRGQVWLGNIDLRAINIEQWKPWV